MLLPLFTVVFHVLLVQHQDLAVSTDAAGRVGDDAQRGGAAAVAPRGGRGGGASASGRGGRRQALEADHLVLGLVAAAPAAANTFARPLKKRK